ncbi:MAG: UbiA family prenyltransferase [Deltaproteobacteria bacterium]|nr:UbiA family prenyltransferase [Deltaproteobacteria bacterium]MBW1951849.1 UbiA family prenyltransferase [Deltaproteobacteria bacterium]MBW1986571.1 UbiA family prenyltransferase [Deltaproteobacteria bacterium]MBW2133729.1 UbiA family prenyltransferase [Deltaproteobacteria bacterium]
MDRSFSPLQNFLKRKPKTENRKPFFPSILILLQMIKIEHTVFALPFAFMGALLAARGLPSARQALFILLAMIGARSTAMAFNRLVDAPYDALNPRTQKRALPQGLISRAATIQFILVSTLLFFWAAAQLNRLCLLLSPLALAVVLLYSFTKRFTWACHLFLGAALAIAPSAGWIAVRGDLTVVPVVLSLAVLLWVAGFDILYALPDEEFDRQVGLYSCPGRFGRVKAMRLAAVLHLGAGVGFVLTGWLAGLSWLYWGMALITGVLLLAEHILLSPHDLSRLNHAFFTLNSLVGVLLGLATLFSLWP